MTSVVARAAPTGVQRAISQPSSPSRPSISTVSAQSFAKAQNHRKKVLEVLFPKQQQQEQGQQPSSDNTEADDAEIATNKGDGRNEVTPSGQSREKASRPRSSRSVVQYDEESNRYVLSSRSLNPQEATDETENSSQFLRTCSICLEEIEVSDITVCGCSCKHEYHYDCIMSWMMTPPPLHKHRNQSYDHTAHDDCPICRRPLWDAETYKAIAEAVGPVAGEGVSERNNNDTNEGQTIHHASVWAFASFAFIIMLIALGNSDFEE